MAKQLTHVRLCPAKLSCAQQPTPAHQGGATATRQPRDRRQARNLQESELTCFIKIPSAMGSLGATSADINTHIK